MLCLSLPLNPGCAVAQFKWNTPETGGLEILEFRLQIKKPPPASAGRSDDEEVGTLAVGP